MQKVLTPEKHRVVWCSTLASRRLERPTMILTAARLQDLAHWREANRWADPIPVVVFGNPDELPPACKEFAFPSPGALTAVLGAPPACLLTLPSKGEAHSERERQLGGGHPIIGRYLATVQRVAEHAPAGPSWWVCSEADDGLGAVMVAHVRGAAVAHASLGTQIGPMGSALANRLDVSVAVHDVGGGVA